MQAIAVESPPRIVERLINFRPTRRAAESYAIIMPPHGSPIAGTDGNVLSQAFGASGYAIHLDSLPGAFAIPLSSDLSAIASAVVRIRDVFSLNMSELAQALDVTRPTLYAWLKGSEPRPSVRGQIWQLATVAERISALGLSSRKILRSPLGGEQSIVSAVINRRGVEEAAIRLEQTVTTQHGAIEAPRRRRFKRVYAAEDISSVVSVD